MRSEPGKGRVVRLFSLADVTGIFSDGREGLSWLEGNGEDYANTDLPLVVKIDRTFTPTSAAKWLHKLADDVASEGNQWREELPETVPPENEGVDGWQA